MIDAPMWEIEVMAEMTNTEATTWVTQDIDVGQLHKRAYHSMANSA